MTKGVCFSKSKGKWLAYVQVGGKTKRLGSHTTEEAAIAARKAAEVKYPRNLYKSRKHTYPELETGIYFKGYSAYGTKDGKTKYLGTYSTLEAARHAKRNTHEVSHE